MTAFTISYYYIYNKYYCYSLSIMKKIINNKPLYDTIHGFDLRS